MDEKYKEIDILQSKIEALKEELYEKQEEMTEIAKDINLGYGDEEHLSEDSFFEGWGEIYVDDEKLKMKTSEKKTTVLFSIFPIMLGIFLLVLGFSSFCPTNISLTNHGKTPIVHPPACLGNRDLNTAFA